MGLPIAFVELPLRMLRTQSPSGLAAKISIRKRSAGVLEVQFPLTDGNSLGLRNCVQSQNVCAVGPSIGIKRNSDLERR